MVAAAAELIAARGVDGTSLQDVADHLGVTKAAVYHRFPAKAQLVLAVVEPVVERLRGLADEATGLDEPTARRAVVLGLIDLVAEHRGIASSLRLDPAMTRLIDEAPGYRQQLDRINALLLGPEPTPARRAGLLVAGGGIMAVGSWLSTDEVPRDELAAAMLRALDD